MNNHHGSDKRRLFYAVLAAWFLVAIVVGSTIYWAIDYNLNSLVMNRRQSVGVLSSTLISERLDRVVDLGISLAERRQFSALVAKGEWESAIQIMNQVPNLYEYVDRVFITDINGVLLADTPQLAGGVVGQNFSDRDWYKGVTLNWQPYISNVYTRAALPRENVVAAAFPIFHPDQPTAPTGILVLQITLNTFHEWVSNGIFANDGVAYVVDHDGQIVAHPDPALTNQVTDLSTETQIIRVLNGDAGIIEVENQTGGKDLVVFEPISKYGWGMLVAQDLKEVLSEKNATLMLFGLVYLTGFSLSLLLIYIVFRALWDIEQKQTQYSILLSSIGDGVVAIDKSWQITYVNNAATSITGFTAAELVGQQLTDVLAFIRIRDRGKEIEFIQQAMISGENTHPSEDVAIISKDQTEIPVGDTVAPIFDESGKAVGAIIVFRDISHEIEADRTKSSFAYASHQLRTPVSKALWILELLMKNAQGSAFIDQIEDAYSAVKSVRKLTSQIEEVSRIDQELISTKPELVKLKQLVEEVRSGMSKVLGRNLDQVQIVANEGEVELSSDPALIQRIIFEIVDNALLYSADQSNIQIKLSKVQNGALIEISNVGIGIPEEDKPTVFTKFFRGTNFDSTEIVGAGLGLYISKSYTELLGGKIWFKSEQNGATTFSVALPNL